MQQVLQTHGVHTPSCPLRSAHSRSKRPAKNSLQSTRAQQGTQTSSGSERKSQGSQSQNQADQQKPSATDRNQQASSSRSADAQQDDASRYPSKDWTAGGWAGGETGLRQFIAEGQQQEGTAPKGKASSSKSAKSNKGPSQGDDPRRYPSKDRLGGLEGVTGGFAGGERGLQQFVEKGDLTFADESAQKQTSPIAIAGLLGLAATAGGILLTDSIDIGEEFLSGKFPSSLPTGKLDSTTRLALEVALGLIALTTFLAGGRALVLKLSSAIQSRTASVSRALIVLIFALGVLAAARYILETS